MEHYEVIADDYDEILLGDEVAVKNRDAFREIVTSTVPRDHLLVDFGGGTGMDAAFYANKGYTVLIFEPSNAMRSVAQNRISKNISNGEIVVAEEDFEEFIDLLSRQSRPVSIVSNFGPLNHLPEPDNQIDQLASVVSSGGYFIHCILRPLFFGFLRKSSYRRQIFKVWMNNAVGIQDGEYRLNLFRLTYLKRILKRKFKFLKSVKSHPKLCWGEKGRFFSQKLTLLSRRYVFVVFQRRGNHENR